MSGFPAFFLGSLRYARRIEDVDFLMSPFDSLGIGEGWADPDRNIHLMAFFSSGNKNPKDVQKLKWDNTLSTGA